MESTAGGAPTFSDGDVSCQIQTTHCKYLTYPGDHTIGGSYSATTGVITLHIPLADVGNPADGTTLFNALAFSTSSRAAAGGVPDLQPDRRDRAVQRHGRMSSVPKPKFCPGFERSHLNQVVGTAGADTLSGTDGPDVICGLGGDDTLTGLGGDDILLGGGGNDTLDGGRRRRRRCGGKGNDTFTGADGADLLQGGPGNDTVHGDAGADTVIGNKGADHLFGDAGNDHLRGVDNVKGNDALDGGAGTDTCAPTRATRRRTASGPFGSARRSSPGRAAPRTWASLAGFATEWICVMRLALVSNARTAISSPPSMRTTMRAGFAVHVHRPQHDLEVAQELIRKRRHVARPP